MSAIAYNRNIACIVAADANAVVGDVRIFG
jgi:hypothetical protein